MDEFDDLTIDQLNNRLIKVKARIKSLAEKEKLNADEEAELTGLTSETGVVSRIKSNLDGKLADRQKREAALKSITDLDSYLGTAAPEASAVKSTQNAATHGAKVGADLPNGQIIVTPGDSEDMSLGSLIAGSSAVKSTRNQMSSGCVSLQFSSDDLKRIGGPKAIKTLMTTSAGWAAPRIREPGQIELVARPRSIIDLITTEINTPQTISYMRMSTRTDAAAAAAEGSAGGESAYAWTEITSNAVSVQAWLPVTEQQLEVESQLAGIIDRLMTENLRLEEERQLLSGNAGATPKQMGGILLAAGLLTEAAGAAKHAIKIANAATKIMIAPGTYAMPTHLLVHPTNWKEISTETDSNGQFLLGHPLVASNIDYQYRPVPSLGLTVNTGLLGDFSKVKLKRCNQVTVDFGWINDDFIKHRRAVRVRVLEHLVIENENAFCSINFAAS